MSRRTLQELENFRSSCKTVQVYGTFCGVGWFCCKCGKRFSLMPRWEFGGCFLNCSGWSSLKQNQHVKYIKLIYNEKIMQIRNNQQQKKFVNLNWHLYRIFWSYFCLFERYVRVQLVRREGRTVGIIFNRFVSLVFCNKRRRKVLL